MKRLRFLAGIVLAILSAKRKNKIFSPGLLCACLSVIIALGSMPGCSFAGKAAKQLAIEEVPSTPGDGGSSDGDEDFDIPVGKDGLHPVFSSALGVPVKTQILASIQSDLSGNTILTDTDGDGIANEDEITSNPYVADYPKVAARISAPVTMEIRVSLSSESLNHTETLEDSDMKETISNSMDSTEYTSLNAKTVPYHSIDSQSTSESHDDEFGYSQSFSGSFEGKFACLQGNVSVSGSYSENSKVADSFSQSTMSDKVEYKATDFVDNMDKNGIEFKNQTVQNITKNYRKSTVLKETDKIGPNDGFVRATLFLKNQTTNIPVKISNVVCTLSFRTPAGEFLPVKTFKLRNDDYSEFCEEVYGDEELGPYTVEVENLNTAEVRKALANGYMPQIHVVSYKMDKVTDSNYNPGVENLKIVEETAKGRTATIKISAPGMREFYRVAAFDTDANGNVVPGISLKKALYHILADRIGDAEQWETDRKGNPLTVADANLRWVKGSADKDVHGFGVSGNVSGNYWRNFSTKVKRYKDEFGAYHYIETIKRLNDADSFNPFDPDENSSYNPSVPLDSETVGKTRYWVILHNGRYFEGDINDAIWAGERYEIALFDYNDFNEHFEGFSYAPLQSQEEFSMHTEWNALTNNGTFARSKYLGKIMADDVVHLELNLEESRKLINEYNLFGTSSGVTDIEGLQIGKSWNGFSYLTSTEESELTGIPKSFEHTAVAGNNSISVNIGYSENANTYRINIKSASDASWNKDVYITRTELLNNYQIAYINSQTISGGAAIGEIPAGAYTVKVYARGKLYGCELEIPSDVNESENLDDVSRRTPTVIDPLTSPAYSSFDVSGLQNQLAVRISGGDYTEYYSVVVTGPLNTAYSAYCQTKTFTGHKGTNYLTIDNPMVDPSIISDPGLYSIEVKSKNKNDYVSGRSNGTMYATVTYEKYANQKLLTAAQNKLLQKLEAVDLEVNFNDGSGWFRLQLNSNDYTTNCIDCRYTSYVELDKQKFHIFFKPPAGIRNDSLFDSIANVFFGGRDDVDLYVRTVADPVYRDTFWPKPDSSVSILSPSGVTSLVDWWIQNPLTDASQVESTLASYTVANQSAFNGTFGLYDAASGGINSYFFYPLVYNKFSVTASIDESYAPNYTFTMDEPVYTVTSGERQITISNISAQYASYFKVYWKVGTTYTEGENMLGGNWCSQELNEGDDDFVISSLAGNQNYIVAVQSFGNNGSSKAHVYINSNGDVVPVLTGSGVPSVAPSITVFPSTSQSTAQLVASNLFAEGETRYAILYRIKKTPEEDWTTYDTYLNGGSYEIYPVTKVLTNLASSTTYEVKAAAVSTMGTYGPYSEVQEVMTGTAPYNGVEFGIGTANSGVQLSKMTNRAVASGYTLADFTNFVGSGTSVDINNIKLPSNVSRYKVKIELTGRGMIAVPVIAYYSGGSPCYTTTVSEINTTAVYQSAILNNSERSCTVTDITGTDKTLINTAPVINTIPYQYSTPGTYTNSTGESGSSLSITAKITFYLYGAGSDENVIGTVIFE